MWYERLRRPWRNLESRRHLLHHAKDREGDDSSERAVAREQLFWSSTRPRGGGGAYFQLKHHAYYVLYSIFNIFNIESILNQYSISISIRPYNNIEY